MASTETASATPLAAIERAAAEGRLPVWASAGPARREHMARVASLLEEWARKLDLPEPEVIRWRAVGFLHDALRDADPSSLKPDLPPEEQELPPRVLHGPAAARRLEGEVDARLVTAIRYHTVGHPALDDLGRALYLADFLEPGRPHLSEWRRALRERMPDEFESVLIDVVAARIRHLLDRRSPLRPETAAFWSSIVDGSRS